jgi:glycosyltransferase involved in cell wall biosynthesis
MIDSQSKPRVLMELHPAMQSTFAGIPQETRLLFSAFQSLLGLETHGLLNNGSFRTTGALRPGEQFTPDTVHRRYAKLSRYVVSQKARPNPTVNKLLPLFRRGESSLLNLQTLLGMKQPLGVFDPVEFEDFIWESLFSKTLGMKDKDAVCNAVYRTLHTSWRALHQAGLDGLGLGLPGIYPALDTRDYRIFLTQTPYPATVSPNTQMVVRYHDAIPVFLPHHIAAMEHHRAKHHRTLVSNAKHALFVCGTEAARADLLKLFPRLEKRCLIVPHVVSHGYYPEKVERQAAADIIRTRIEGSTEPETVKRSGSRFYDKSLSKDGVRFLLIVSTLESRKNHVRLVRAWERLRERVGKGLKLVVVAHPGWQFEQILQVFRPWQERGELFHLSGVPTADLRRLYNLAEAVICPSVAEGFDLSGVEGQMCGTPVAASGTAVHREVYGDGARYFDTYSVQDMANQIEALLRDATTGQREEIAATAIANASRYGREVIAPKWTELFGRIEAKEFDRR